MYKGQKNIKVASKKVSFSFFGGSYEKQLEKVLNEYIQDNSIDVIDIHIQHFGETTVLTVFYKKI